ncbi:MAG: hypothetical protein F6K14_14090 [Symploca sp. SIO2C1]|nr:hypothetical protein [Symploca sp. SIO2C1]
MTTKSKRKLTASALISSVVIGAALIPMHKAQAQLKPSGPVPVHSQYYCRAIVRGFNDATALRWVDAHALMQQTNGAYECQRMYSETQPTRQLYFCTARLFSLTNMRNVSSKEVADLQRRTGNGYNCNPINPTQLYNCTAQSEPLIDVTNVIWEEARDLQLRTNRAYDCRRQ